MTRTKLLQASSGLAFALLVTACTVARESSDRAASDERPARQTANRDVLTAAERELAAELVRGADRAAPAFATDRPMYLVDMELLRSKEDESRRMALVTHYRYEGNMAVRSVVDLTARRVLEVEMTPDVPVPFAEEELERARELALADEQLRIVIVDNLDGFTSARPGYEIQGLGMRAASPEDPLYGHRVVSLLFDTPSGYITGVEVVVDLTTETVQVRRQEGYF
jgi:hypothetical protein